MPVPRSATLLVALLLTASTAFAIPAPLAPVVSLIARENPSTLEPRWGKVTPKVLIISMVSITFMTAPLALVLTASLLQVRP